APPDVEDTPGRAVVPSAAGVAVPGRRGVGRGVSGVAEIPASITDPQSAPGRTRLMFGGVLKTAQAPRDHDVERLMTLGEIDACDQLGRLTVGLGPGRGEERSSVVVGDGDHRVAAPMDQRRGTETI